jgi:cellulose synthase (UDP-forming)
VSLVTAAVDRRQARTTLVLPEPPDDEEKYSYIQRSLPYLTTTLFVGAASLIVSQIRFELHDLVLLPFLLFTATYVVYQALSLPVNFAGRGFDLAAHQARIRGWRPSTYPRVDILLPICGFRAYRGVRGSGAGLCPGRRALR